MDGITSKQILCIGLLSAVMLSSCTKPVLDRSVLMMNWQPIDSLQTILPAGVVVFAGRNDSLPLRAWYVRIDESHPDVLTRVVVSDDATDNRETISSFANDLGACVVVNGGYFNMGQLPASHAGLLLVDTDLLAPATKIVMRDTLRYETARAALGFTENDEIEITWATTRNGSLYTWPNPPAHSPEQPAAPVDYDIADRWIVRDALGAGPMLLAQNELKITSDEEVFFGTSIPNIHPRTAAGRAEALANGMTFVTMSPEDTETYINAVAPAWDAWVSEVEPKKGGEKVREFIADMISIRNEITGKPWTIYKP